MPSPLGDQAALDLMALSGGPVAAQIFNPGVSRKLMLQGYAETVDLPSPYPTHKGAKIAHLKITAKGRTYLENGI